MRKAVFLDKDGTLIHDIPYNVNPALIELMPGAGYGLWRLYAAGYDLIVVSNQSGVARGFFREEALHYVEQRLHLLMAEVGVRLSGFYYCPHLPNGEVVAYSIDCDCRKPAPGLLVRAATDLNIDLSQSWLIGDILNDVEAGHRAGCRSVLLDNGNETEWELSSLRRPDFIADDLTEAAGCILDRSGSFVTAA